MCAYAQDRTQALAVADWYHLGNSLVDLSLAGLASGPVDRVWYSPDGATLFISTASGKIFQTADFDSWQAAPPGTTVPVPQQPAAPPRRMPEPGAQIRTQVGQGSTLYAFSRFVYSSQDGGLNWDNLTGFRSRSIVGGGLRDMAISPRNPEEVVVAGAAGVFRTLDGGKSWAGLNQGLPNLPAARFRSLPSGEHGAQIEFTSPAFNGGVVEWRPGERQAWRPTDSSAAILERTLRLAYGTGLGAPVTALSPLDREVLYAGMADGTIRASADRGGTWQPPFAAGANPVERFWVDPSDARLALAVAGSHVFKTMTGGTFWDDLELPDIPAHGVAASRASGAIYVATDLGVFYARTDLYGAAAEVSWRPLAGLPSGAATDVQLDGAETQLWVMIQGYGVYSGLAPHRLGDPRVVSAADLALRAAAPGALMSIAGAKVSAARAGDLTVPVLHSGDTESQIQIPFEARGSSLSLSIDAGSGRRVLANLPLDTVSPAIMVDHDGSPFLFDGATGTMLDTVNTAHSQSRVQAFATGLGRVTPDWPDGMMAPLENPSRVRGTVTATLDGSPIEVTRATLAPGYIGFYLVEVQLPKIVNTGPAALEIAVDGHPSNTVRLYIEP